MDFAETDERQLLRASVAGIASGFGHRYYSTSPVRAAAARSCGRRWPRPATWGSTSPPAYGGGGMGLSELAVVGEESAAVGAPVLLLWCPRPSAGPSSPASPATSRRRAGCPRLAGGRAKMAFAITEPDAGSNSHPHLARWPPGTATCTGCAGPSTTSRVSTTRAQMLVVTRTGTDEATGRGRLSLFVVDTDAPGLTKEVIEVEITAPEKQFTLTFDNVEVPADRLVGGEGSGLSVLFAGLNPERILSAALCNGVARYALAKASAYARDRAVWGAPIGTHQGVAHPLAEAAIDVELARLMTDKAAWLYDARPRRRRGVQHGEAGGGRRRRWRPSTGPSRPTGATAWPPVGLATLWGITRLLKVAPVSREMILNFVAQHSLGLPRSY